MYLNRKKIEISSNQNVQFKQFKSLTESKGLKKEGLCLLSGKKLIQEFLEQQVQALKPLKIIGEICSIKSSVKSDSDNSPHYLKSNLDTNTEYKKNSKLALDTAINELLKSVPQYLLSAELFNSIDMVGTDQNILIVEQPQMTVFDFTANTTANNQGLSLLCPLGDPNNLGAIIRSAEAFGAERVILLQEAAHAFLPKTIKASAGSVFRVPLFKGPSIRELSQTQKNTKSSIIVLDLNGEELPKFQWPKNSFLLIGEEGPGAPSDLAATRLNIPTKHVESLNAMVAASIAMYDYSQKSKIFASGAAK